MEQTVWLGDAYGPAVSAPSSIAQARYTSGFFWAECEAVVSGHSVTEQVTFCAPVGDEQRMAEGYIGKTLRDIRPMHGKEWADGDAVVSRIAAVHRGSPPPEPYFL